MSPDRPTITPGSESPEYVERLRNVVTRFAVPERASPADLAGRAEALLASLAPSSASVHVRARPSHVTLSGEHTHYFDGFALLVPLLGGTAAAVRRSDEPGLRLRLESAMRSSEPGPIALVRRVVEEAVAALAPEAGLDVAVHVAQPPECREALVASVAGAVVEALAATLERDVAGMPEPARQIAEAALGRRYGSVFLLASQAGFGEDLVLVDTATREWLPVECPPRERLGWALVNTHVFHDPGTEFYRTRAEEALQALALLQKEAFPNVGSLRELAHRDLPRALSVLPRKLTRMVRHLIMENQRVQRMIVALRRHDGQMLGANLLMGQASLREDWRVSAPEIDFVVSESERADGIYGARVTGAGFGGCILVAGRGFALPVFLDEIETSYERQFGLRPSTLLL
jgi:galactokinase